MRRLITLPVTLFKFIFGRLSYQPPAWLRGVLALHWIVRVMLFSTVISAALLVQYWQAIFPPIAYYTVHTSMVDSQFEPEKTSFGNLTVTFSAPNKDTIPPPQRPPIIQPRVLPPVSLNADSVASLALLDQKTVNQHIRLTPHIDGNWQWKDDRHLVFSPAQAWLPSTQYKMTLAPELFAQNINVNQVPKTFTSTAFTAAISDYQLYQDPKALNIRRAIATLSFSHPVVVKEIEQALQLYSLDSDTQGIGKQLSHNFSVTSNKAQTDIYVQSEPLVIGESPRIIYLQLNAGFTSLFKENKPLDKLTKTLILPDRYNFLKVKDINSTTLSDSDGVPQKNLVLTFTDSINAKQLSSKLNVYALPRAGQPGGKSYWRQGSELSQKALNAMTPIKYNFNPIATDVSTEHSLQLTLTDDTSILVDIDGGLRSVNDFKTPAKTRQIVRVANYPKTIEFMGQGAVLSASGNHTISVATRGLSGLKYTIHRIDKDNLNHLVSQTSGDITSAKFKNWYFNENNIGEKIEQTVHLNTLSPQQTNYSQLDLKRIARRYSKDMGLYLIQAQGYNHDKKRTYGPTAKRLILITDLGVIVKHQNSNTSDVFVQSLSSGKPVVNAKVELLGSNGRVLFSRFSGEQGHVKFPSTNGMTDDKKPTVYVVTSGPDVSFIPYKHYSQQLNMSKFDIGGVYQSANDSNQLNAMLFTDRGIYRPGETVKIASIIKRSNLDLVANVPLTLIIIDAKYKVVKKHKFMSNPSSGFNEFSFKTRPDGNTGSYRAGIYLDQNKGNRHLHSINFKVEEFQPDSMKISTQLLAVNNQGWTISDKLMAEVSLTNLFDAPAQNRKVTGALTVKPQQFRFAGYEDYQFITSQHDSKKNPLLVNKKLPQQVTDERGLAMFELDLTQFQQGMYQVLLNTQGFEASGGRSVRATASTLVSPLDRIIGFKANGSLNFIHKDSARRVSLIAIDNNLTKVTYPNLTQHWYRLSPQSSLVKQANGTYKYQQTERRELLSSSDTTISDSGNQLDLDTGIAGKYRIEIENMDGLTVASIDYHVVAQANIAGDTDISSDLTVTLDQSDYTAGETIQLSIVAPFEGNGLITIEDNEVQAFKWFSMNSKRSLQSITIPSHLEGNAYINVSFVRAADSPDIYTNPLVYAVVPFNIDKSQRQVDIKLSTAKITRPGKAMAIEYSTDKDSDMIIFAIDEGILQVANYQVPDPLAHFLKKRALTVTTNQILDLILPEFSLESLTSASGGGVMALRSAMAKNLNPFQRKQRAPAVFWSGLVPSSRESQQLEFTVPEDFSGQLRVMAIAVSKDAVGTESRTTVVRGPFVLTANDISHVAPNDQFDITLNVANFIQDSGANAAISITASSSEALTFISPNTQQITIDEGSEQAVTFTLKALNTLGNADVTFVASYRDEQSRQTSSISIRPNMPRQTRLTSGMAKGSTTLDVDSGFYSELAQQQVFASPSPMVLIEGMTHYLEEFPHGCTEQIVSQVFPLVGLSKHPSYKRDYATTKAHIDEALMTLTQRQRLDGGFSFWPGGQGSHTQASLHAIHFLLDTKHAGFNVSQDLIDNSIKFLSKLAMATSTNLADARRRSKAIYLLTRTGMLTTNLLLDLEQNLQTFDSADWKIDLLNSYMGASYLLLQAKNKGKTLISKYDFSSNKVVNELDSSLSQHSQHIYLLATHFESKARALPQKRILALTAAIENGQYNTVSAAYSTLALGALDSLKIQGQSEFSFNAQDVADTPIEIDIKQHPFSHITFPVTTKNITITDQNNSGFYYLSRQSGYPQQAAPTAVNNGIEITKHLTDLDGNTTNTFTVGDEAIITLRMRATGNVPLKRIAIVDLLPGGTEIIRNSIAKRNNYTGINHIDIREDRAVLYANLSQAQTSITYRIKFTSAGIFSVPPSHAKSMYQLDKSGYSASSQITVIAD